MLCEVCSSIHFKPIGDYGFSKEEVQGRRPGRHDSRSLYYFHHKNKNALCAAANDGCHFCLMLRQVLSRELPSILPEGPPVFAGGAIYLILDEAPSTADSGYSYMKVSVACPGDSAEGQLGLVTQGKNYTPSRKRASRRHDVPHPMILENMKASISSSDLDRTTMSPANVIIAKTWIANCMDCHHPCDAGDVYPAFPRRVVDLSDLGTPRLIDGNIVKAQYVALSYKWGKSRKCITTLDNLEQRQHSIPVETLPKTFREAFEMTHSLGFRYLWIDSLCIIQDSKEDLDREIKSMDRVYQNATLTIFAAGADDVDSGLSFSRNAQETKPCQVNIKFTADGQTSDITTLVTFYRDRIPSGHYPLFDRGWVLQEQLMSRRCLIFGSQYISWECLCTASSEKWPTVTGKIEKQENDLSDRRSYTNGEVIPLMRRAFVSHPTGRPDQVFDRWYDMVENYCMRSLSYRQDVLPALNGLSNAMGKAYKYTPAYGLWLEDLAGSLTWYTQKPLGHSNKSLLKTERHTKDLIGYPSWTWAVHWEKEVRFRRTMHGTFRYFEYEGVKKSQAESATEITALILRGCLITAKVGPLLVDWKSEYHERPLWTSSVHDVVSGKEVGNIAYDEDPETVNVSEITCFLCSKGNFFPECEPLRFLALVPTMGLENEYRRIGLVFLHETNVSGHIDRFLQMTTNSVSKYSWFRLV